MSNISRRKFLKGAGVAALAVAAAGVLAGCSDKDTPDTGKKLPITLHYYCGEVTADVDYEVNAGVTEVSFDTIVAKTPEKFKDYRPVVKGNHKIESGVVKIEMEKNATADDTHDVNVEYWVKKGTGDEKLNGTDLPSNTKFTVENVDVNADTINTDGLLPSTSEYQPVDKTAKIEREGTKVYAKVYVKKTAATGGSRES